MILAFVLFFLVVDPPPPTVPAGTQLRAKLQSEVKTGRTKTGETVAAVVTVPLRASKTVIVPKGSLLSGRVETIQAATPTEEGRVRLVFRDLQFPDGRHVSTWITNSFEAPQAKRKLRYALFMTAGAAGTGAIAGKSAR